MRLPPRMQDVLSRRRLRVVDVGARGGWSPKWRPFKPWITLIGFEPEPTEFSRLEATASEHEIILPDALYRTDGDLRFYQTRNPYCGSLYPPNQTLVHRLRPDDQQLDVLRTTSVRVTTMDSALNRIGVDSADFIKLDTQGSELDILVGSERLLDGGVFGVEVEVQFMPLYSEAPQFSDVNAFLEGKGFALMGFPSICSVADFRAASDGRTSGSMRRAVARWMNRLRGPFGSFRGERQLLYGDAIYLRPAEPWANDLQRQALPVETVLARVILLCSAVGYYEHAQECIEAAATRGFLNDRLRADLEGIVHATSRSRARVYADVKNALRRLVHRFPRR